MCVEIKISEQDRRSVEIETTKEYPQFETIYLACIEIKPVK